MLYNSYISSNHTVIIFYFYLYNDDYLIERVVNNIMSDLLIDNQYLIHTRTYTHQNIHRLKIKFKIYYFSIKRFSNSLNEKIALHLMVKLEFYISHLI